ncbi:MAG: hypothetical protein AAFQ42_10635 [Pseudomonadota bacterium]
MERLAHRSLPDDCRGCPISVDLARENGMALTGVKATFVVRQPTQCQCPTNEEMRLRASGEPTMPKERLRLIVRALLVVTREMRALVRDHGAQGRSRKFKDQRQPNRECPALCLRMRLRRVPSTSASAAAPASST